MFDNLIELKTDKNEFQQTWDLKKLFEIRKNDRNFRLGQLILLRETEHTGEQMKDGKPLVYTGRVIKVRICNIMEGPTYALPKGWVIFSIHVLGINKAYHKNH